MIYLRNWERNLPVLAFVILTSEENMYFLFALKHSYYESGASLDHICNPLHIYCFSAFVLWHISHSWLFQWAVSCQWCKVLFCVHVNIPATKYHFTEETFYIQSEFQQRFLEG